MRYTENYDPGFKELSVEDLVPILQTDTKEQAKLRNQLIVAVYSEYDRLKLDIQYQEYLQHLNGVNQLESAPLFQLKLYSDCLKTLERK